MVGVLARRDPGPHRGPAPSTRRWILVGNPPLEWPGASFGVPSLRPPHDDGRGSRCCRPSGACRVQFQRGSSRVQDMLPKSRQGPAAELTADRGPFAELFGQVAPGRTASCSPENPIQNKTMIGWLAPCGCRTARIKPSKKAHSSSDIRLRAKLHLPRGDELESQSVNHRNHFRQHKPGHVDKWRNQSRIEVMSMKPRKLSAVLS